MAHVDTKKSRTTKKTNMSVGRKLFLIHSQFPECGLASISEFGAGTFLPTLYHLQWDTGRALLLLLYKLKNAMVEEKLK